MINGVCSTEVAPSFVANFCSVADAIDWTCWGRQAAFVGKTGLPFKPNTQL